MSLNIQFEGIKVSYRVTGKGKTLVLLHGYLETGDVWQPFADMLSEEFRIVTVDLPGHGDSEVKGQVHSMEFLARAVRAVMSDAGENRVLMIGHSLGGYVTLAFAELFPELLSGFVLFASHPHADSTEAVAKRNREIAVVKAGKKNIMYPGNISMMFAEKNLRSMSAELRRSKMIASRIPGEGIIAMLNGMIARPSRQALVESGAVPLLWLLGRHDLYFSPEKAIRDTRLPDNAEVEILENSGHLGFIEEKERSRELVTGFARKLDWQMTDPCDPDSIDDRPWQIPDKRLAEVNG
ncbi:MAG: alpha/beta hydrolase [Bacteroidales bacterium]|nr:alpha/beta hydrolase [Bacteroidales bacterium]